MMLKKIGITSVLALLAMAFMMMSCNIEPTNPGKAKGNQPPETFISPVPPEGSMNNPFRLRLEWRGNDPDGRVKEYQYRLDGPLFDNTWQTTTNFYKIFKLRNGWYTIQVRAVDDEGAIDETPATRRFHVLGPTFDKGILVVDDDMTTDDEKDARKDALMDSLLIRAGYTQYTVWDFQEMFGYTESIAFTGKGIDLNGNEYDGLASYSTVIWYTGTGGENNVSKNERLFIDYLDMGGNLWLSGSLVMISVLGDTARGEELSDNSFARKYLKIQKAKAAIMNTDYFISMQPGYPDLDTRYIVPTSGLQIYLSGSTDQLIPTPEAEVIYTFSNNVWVDDSFNQVRKVNDEEFAGTPVAIRYIGKIYKTITFGFPLVKATKRGRRYRNNILNEDQMVQVTRQILMNEFGEIPR